MALIIILAVVGITLVFVIATYNNLVKKKNLVSESWSGIEVQLKKRYDLIPNLINTVKGYASHEKELLSKITEFRSRGVEAKTVKDQQEASEGLSGALSRLFAVAENYPDLKANQNFLDLQAQLRDIEQDIQMARRYYNGTVRDNNILIESFPSNIIANLFTFKKADYFEIEEAAERAVPKVEF